MAKANGTASPAPKKGASKPGQDVANIAAHPKNQNPHFERAGRPVYEIGRLLQQLPADYSPYSRPSDEHHAIAIAAGMHATNASSTLLAGMQALGSAMCSSAIANHDAGSGDFTQFVSLSDLINHLAVELEWLLEIEFVGETAKGTLSKGGA